MLHIIFSSRKSRQGSTLLASMLLIAALSAVVAISVNRNSASQLTTSLQNDFSQSDTIKDSIVQDVLLQAKEHVWVDGLDIGSLLPTGVDRFETWYSDTYEVLEYETGGAGATADVAKSIDYTVAVGDNSDGDGDLTTDTDNKVYIQLTFNYEGEDNEYLLLISPGRPAVVTSIPADIVAGTGGCIEDVELGEDFWYDLKAGSFVSGLDTTRAGQDDLGGACVPRTAPDGTPLPDYCGCAGSATDCEGPMRDIEDTYVATSNLFSDVTVCDGSTSGCEPVQNFEGKEPDVWPTTDPPLPAGEYFSFYEADKDDPGEEYTEYCNSMARVLDVSDDLVAANDPRVSFFEKNNGGKLKINGNITFGTEDNPEILYIKTPNLSNRVIFKGEVEGYGILIALGNVIFEKDLDWNGIIYNDDIVKGTYLRTNKKLTNYGSVMMQNMRVNTRFDYNGGMDFMFRGETNLYYSSYAVDNVMQKVDDNYTTVSVPQPVLVESIQHIN